MKSKQIILDFDSGKIVDDIGGISMTSPSLVAGSVPTFDIQFAIFSDGAIVQPDLSEAISWRGVVDKDFNHDNDPMAICPFASAVISGAPSGLISFTFDCTGQAFLSALADKESISCFMEFYGLNSSNEVIYDYRITCNALNTLEINHS